MVEAVTVTQSKAGPTNKKASSTGRLKRLEFVRRAVADQAKANAPSVTLQYRHPYTGTGAAVAAWLNDFDWLDRPNSRVAGGF
jgi:hypothetical protein